MERKFNIDIVRIWRELVAELTLKRRSLFRVLLLPAVLMAIMEQLAVESGAALTLLVTAIYWGFAAMFAVSTHRVVLLDPASVTNPWGVYVDRYVLRYIGYSFLIGFDVFFVITGAVLLSVPFSTVLPVFVNLALIGVLWLTLIYLMGRVGMVLPAQAVGDRLDLVDMFKATAGNGWRLVGATVLPMIAAGILLYPLALMVEHSPFWLATLPAVLYVLVSGMVGIAVVSCAYRELKRLPDFPQSSV